MRKNKPLVCPNCGREAPRLITPPLPPELSLVSPRYRGPVCERCLKELEEEFSRDRDSARPR